MDLRHLTRARRHHQRRTHPPLHAYRGPPLPSTATITLPWRQRPLVADPADAADLAH